MLYTIKNQDHQLLSFVKDDPVRPELSPQFRVTDGRFICALVEEDQPHAIVCVSLHDAVPSEVAHLNVYCEKPTVAIFYTIWSYRAGAGRNLLISAVNSIREQYPSVNRFVTLSPKTEMAKKFHLKNGAFIFRENQETVNYEYTVT